MRKMNKKIAIAVTVALLAFPLSTTLAMAETSIPTTTAPATTTTDTTTPATTVLSEAEVAEIAVAAYEAAPITTLEEVATAEGLKAAADAAVTAAVDADAKTALELRITTRATAIETAKTILTPVVDGTGTAVESANWFTDLIAKLQLALTFDPARKAELNGRHALAKLAEAQELMKDGETEEAQICLNQYTDKIAKAQEFLAQVADPTSEAAITLNTALANVNSNNIQVLSNLIDKLPPQAAQKLALNVVRSMEKAVNKLQKEEAKVALETASATTAVITPEDRKSLEKQSEVALENFKKSLKQKGKIHIEDLDDQDDQDDQDDEDKIVVEQSVPEVTQTQSITTQSQPTFVKVAPVEKRTAPTLGKSENNKDDRNDRNKHEDSKRDKGGDNRDRK